MESQFLIILSHSGGGGAAHRLWRKKREKKGEKKEIHGKYKKLGGLLTVKSIKNRKK